MVGKANHTSCVWDVEQVKHLSIPSRLIILIEILLLIDQFLF